jgi:large subunit ribosomal protein L24
MNRLSHHVSKGDTVQVVSGNHRGAQGKVLQVINRKNQVLIEGVRLIKKHVRKSQDQPNGAIIEREGPIHVSNVRLIEAGEKAAEKKTEKGDKPAKAKK